MVKSSLNHCERHYPLNVSFLYVYTDIWGIFPSIRFQLATKLVGAKDMSIHNLTTTEITKKFNHRFERERFSD